VKELVYGGFGRITKEVWAKAEDHVLEIEKEYGKENCIDRSINKFFHILQTKSCIVFYNKPFNLCPNKFYGVQFAMANRGS
jgi:hypothetical protein